VNPDDAQDPRFPYPRTFHPDVSDRASAKVITISGGEHVTGADIRLRQKFAPRRVTVRVTWADGRLIRDFVFVEAKGVDHPAAMADAKQPDQKSSVIELTLIAEEAYRIEARLICRYADDHSVGPGATLHSDETYLGAKDELTEVSLTIPANACPEVAGKTSLTGK
jgi:hypothetical protein